MKTASSTITKRYQTSVPKTVREVLGVGPGGRLLYVIDEDTVRLTALKPVGRLDGMLKHDGPVLSCRSRAWSAESPKERP
ncbi:MAG: type II toxin-antitoxin system PrlF family antitoxin [Paracoccaceae bacterium]|nr:type II toxin-antitoxin system PrlF family antitoxin [Paracoccaceae bacterium]